MDLIYGGAKLTIFAAAGKDGSFGLSGISNTPRRRQPSALFCGIRLVSTLCDPSTAIMESKSATRGWCHQEAVLSHRRLFLTEEQSYFMCNGMECCESIHVQFSKLHKKNGQSFAGRKMRFQPYGSRGRRRLFDFLEHVRDYRGVHQKLFPW